jgi:hypothetical protein
LETSQVALGEPNVDQKNVAQTMCLSCSLLSDK